jgi:hypothetical protein
MRELLNIPYSKYYTDERVVDLFIPDEDRCCGSIHLQYVRNDCV